MLCPNHTGANQTCNVIIPVGDAIMNIPQNIPSLVSDGDLRWIRMILLGIVCQLIALFGVITNTINIIVFKRMGFKDPINISLLGLSTSDFFSCLTMMWTCLCKFPPFMELPLPFRPLGFHYIFGTLPHIVCVKITTLITAFITIERCICVTYPLKVRELLTTRRVALVTAFFYLLNFGFAVPFYSVVRLKWLFAPDRNRTVLTMMFAENRLEVERHFLLVHGVIIPMTGFIATVISTIILVDKLRKTAKWREQVTGTSTKTTAASSSSSSSSSGNQVTSRDAKVAKMVVMISTLFIISFSPVMIASAVLPSVPQLATQVSLANVIFYCNFILETSNASLNIFIYYHMSSNYKAIFANMFNIKSAQAEGK